MEQSFIENREITRHGNDRSVFADQKHAERFKGEFYDVPHQFNIEMQDDAFAWLERWLARAK